MRIFALLVFSCSISAIGQQASSTTAGPPAQVTGRVTCGDTGQPARFASVQLIAENPNKDPLIDPASMGKNPDIQKAMAQAMTAPRADVGEFAPKIETISIPTDKIRDVIGTGGKVIREIVEKTGAKVNVEDDGTVKVSASDGTKIKAAIDWIKSLTSEPEIGAIYTGKVVKVVDFGAFVNFFGAKDGLVHVSQISNERVARPQDVLTEGQSVKVKLVGFDDRGKTKLSMKVVDQETGEDLSNKEAVEA